MKKILWGIATGVNFASLVWQVAIPALHISLGIFQRLYTLLENACHDLDVKLAAVAVPVEAKESYMRYAAQLASIRDMEDSMAAALRAAESLQQMALHLALRDSDAGTVVLVTRLLSEAQKQQLEADSLVSALIKYYYA